MERGSCAIRGRPMPLDIKIIIGRLFEMQLRCSTACGRSIVPLSQIFFDGITGSSGFLKQEDRPISNFFLTTEHGVAGSHNKKRFSRPLVPRSTSPLPCVASEGRRGRKDAEILRFLNSLRPWRLCERIFFTKITRT